jgi:uncharacterized protein (DUF433 family)
MAQIERPPWRYRTKAQRDARDVHILELWAMGWTAEMIARKFNLTAPRINQIVASFGAAPL